MGAPSRCSFEHTDRERDRQPDQGGVECCLCVDLCVAKIDYGCGCVVVICELRILCVLQTSGPGDSPCRECMMVEFVRCRRERIGVVCVSIVMLCCRVWLCLRV